MRQGTPDITQMRWVICSLVVSSGFGLNFFYLEFRGILKAKSFPISMILPNLNLRK